jgi:hypothetical protein
MAAAAKVPCRRIGRTGGTDLELTAGARLPLADLKALWNNAIPALVRESES